MSWTRKFWTKVFSRLTCVSMATHSDTDSCTNPSCSQDHEVGDIIRQIRLVFARNLKLASFLQCIPYKIRTGSEETMELTLKTTWWRRLCGVLSVLVGIHGMAHWTVFLHQIVSNGMGVSACIHLTFVAIYAISSMFSLTANLYPEAVLDAQNQIEIMGFDMESTWAQHPLSFIYAIFTTIFFTAFPPTCVGIYIMRPDLPMFLVTAPVRNIFLAHGETVHLIVSLLLGSVEAFVIFYHVLITLCVAQTCLVLCLCLSMWLKEMR